MSEQAQAKRKVQIGDKLRGADKVRTIPMVNEESGYQRKPDWIRVRVPTNGEIQRIKSLLRKQKPPAPTCRNASAAAPPPS